MHQFGVKLRVVEDRVGVRDQEPDKRRDTREREPGEHAPGGVRLRLQVARGARRGEREQHDAGRVLARARQAKPDPRQQVVARAAFAQHSRTPQQRQRQRRQRGHVVKRQMRVEHRQERDPLDGRREQPDAATEQARPGHVQQPQRQRAEQGRRHSRERVHVRRVCRDRLLDAGRPTVGDGEHVVQQVSVGGRVGEVVRVQAVPEHRDRVRHEVIGLIRVVGVGQPLPDAPQSQPESTREHERQPGPRPAARTAALGPARRSRVLAGNGPDGRVPARAAVRRL